MSQGFSCSLSSLCPITTRNTTIGWADERIKVLVGSQNPVSGNDEWGLFTKMVQTSNLYNHG
eukprot:scaffold6499_cov126-Skeletonema_menzelii.AAC.2